VLLDTHVFLWLNTEPERLGERLSLIEDQRSELLLSAASSWEIAIKHGLGRLPLPEPPDRYVPARMRAVGAIALAIEHTHALAVAALPPLHRDPFDRLLVAQAGLLDVPILTADPIVAEYPVQTLMVAGGG
jgi:PIN domain nuclease of toxin-antitoxin system